MEVKCYRSKTLCNLKADWQYPIKGVNLKTPPEFSFNFPRHHTHNIPHLKGLESSSFLVLLRLLSLVFPSLSAELKN